MNEKLKILRAKQDKKKRLEKARASKRETQEQQREEDQKARQEANEAILSRLDALNDLIGTQDYDRLITELSKLDTLKEGLEEINKSIKEQEFTFPDKTKITNLPELANYLKQPKVEIKNVIDEKWQKDLASKLKQISEGIQIVNRDVDEYIPTRRVRLVGNRLVFDDSQWGGGGGGADNSILTLINNKTPDLLGTWAYASGTNGTENITGRVLQITAIALGAAGSLTINGGDTITIPYNATDKASSSITIEPKGNLENPTIVFDAGVDSYFIEYIS